LKQAAGNAIPGAGE